MAKKLSKQQKLYLIQEATQQIIQVVRRLTRDVPDAAALLDETLEGDPSDFGEAVSKMVVSAKELGQ